MASKPKKIDNLPKISILVPARNEEANLLPLFKTLSALEYPLENLEILLGNDNSTDKTGLLMEEFAKDKPWVKVVHLEDTPISKLKGKTRVLDTLIDYSSGDYLFFTDADIVLPPRWIYGMLTEFSDNVGVVVGVTGFKPISFLARMQSVEWLMALSIFKIAADWGFSSTGMGNNMAVSKAAYNKIGGFKTIGFSIVEDYFLYAKIIESGFGFKHAFNADVLAYTIPPKNYFEQRKRWIKGAVESKHPAILAGILQSLSIPILILLGFINIKIPLMVVGLLIVTYTGFIVYFQKRLGLKGYLKLLPAFVFYIPIAWFLQFLYFMFKKDTVWKGRKY